MTVLVIDGQGGRLGKSIVEAVKKKMPNISVMAVGTNYAATESMLRAGADCAATGENPLIVACRSADVIIGPLGIAMADALLGEISPAMAAAVAQSQAFRILIPMNMCGTYVAGVQGSSSAIVDDAVARLCKYMEER